MQGMFPLFPLLFVFLEGTPGMIQDDLQMGDFGGSGGQIMGVRPYS